MRAMVAIMVTLLPGWVVTVRNWNISAFQTRGLYRRVRDPPRRQTRMAVAVSRDAQRKALAASAGLSRPVLRRTRAPVERQASPEKQGLGAPAVRMARRTRISNGG